MCNAWNHAPGCTCGWGGVGHLGIRGPGTYSPYAIGSSYSGVPPIKHTFESFVNPNARCPVCGEPVFFYQSPYGGRVFFDELGPPWPKHPCTDNTSIPKKLGNNLAIKTPNEVKQYGWQANGWSPFFIKHVKRIDKYYLELNGILKGCDLNLNIRFELHSHAQTNAITPDCFAHAKNIVGNQYAISLITTTGRSMLFKAFTNLFELRMSRYAAPKDDTKRIYNLRGKHLRSNTNPATRNHSAGQATSLPNKMALAFADAQHIKVNAKSKAKGKNT